MHHSFDIRLAQKYGIESAILIHHFQHWIGINKKMGKNLHDGKTWTYQTQKYMVANFPYFKNRQHIIRIIDKLVEDGVLVKGNFNKTAFDRTVWYAFSDESIWISGIEFNPELKEDLPLSENGQCIVQKCTIDSRKADNGEYGNGQPIPDTKKTYTKEKKRESACAQPTPSASSQKEEKIAYAENVFLSEKQYEDLCKTIGKDYVHYYIDAINNYIPNSKSKYKDFAAAIRSWYSRDQANGKIPDVRHVQEAREKQEARVDRCKKICEAAEKSLSHLFTEEIYFKCEEKKAILINKIKDIKNEYSYYDFYGEELKKKLLEDLKISFPRAEEILLGKKKFDYGHIKNN